MPKQFTAQKVVSVNPLQFVREGNVLTAIIVTCEVNYGELGMTHQIDIWGDLTDAQKGRAQAVYNFIKDKAESIILG